MSLKSENGLTGYSFTTTVELYEIENPNFSYTETCQKIIDEEYRNRACTYSLGEVEYLPFGSKNLCTIRCEDVK